MKRNVGQFEKVSFEQFKKDWIDTFSNKYNEWDEEETNKAIRSIYNSIKLPKRATNDSAGYDFFCPYHLTIDACKAVKIPTGIKCKMEDGWVLQCYPRSSHGFKYGLHLSNSVGIIDGDYYNNTNNEGHIFCKLINDSVLAQPIKLKSGEAFFQAIFVPYGITYDDDTNEIRNGGLGSTDKK